MNMDRFCRTACIKQQKYTHAHTRAESLIDLSVLDLAKSNKMRIVSHELGQEKSAMCIAGKCGKAAS
jgi:hypothetical protein